MRGVSGRVAAHCAQRATLRCGRRGQLCGGRGKVRGGGLRRGGRGQLRSKRGRCAADGAAVKRGRGAAADGAGGRGHCAADSIAVRRARMRHGGRNFCATHRGLDDTMRLLDIHSLADLTCDPGIHAVCEARRTDESNDKNDWLWRIIAQVRRLLEI